MNIIKDFFSELNSFFHLFDNFLQIIYQFDVLFGIIFILIALYITYFSYRIYVFSKKDSILLFGFSFFLFALAHIMKLALDMSISFEDISRTIVTSMSALDIFHKILFFMHVMLMISGYIMLTLISFKVKHKKIPALLFVLIIAGILVSNNFFITFKVFSIILLLFLIRHFYKNTKVNCNINSTIVFSSFLFILGSEVFTLLMYFSNKFYLLENTFKLFGYLFLLLSVILMWKK